MKRIEFYKIELKFVAFTTIRAFQNVEIFHCLTKLHSNYSNLKKIINKKTLVYFNNYL